MEIIKSTDGDFTMSYIMKDDKPLFKAKEIAFFLKYKNTTEAIRDHVPEKYKMKVSDWVGAFPSYLKEDPKTIFITEPGLYSLIFSSQLPEAIKFQDWVLEEVLPAIRKNGEYKKPEENIKRYIDKAVFFL